MIHQTCLIDTVPVVECVDIARDPVAGGTPCLRILGPKFGIGEIVGHERSGAFARHLVALLDKQDVEQWAVGHDVLNPIHQLARRDAHVRGEDCGKSRLGLETAFGLTIGNERSVVRSTDEPACEGFGGVAFQVFLCRSHGDCVPRQW